MKLYINRFSAAAFIFLSALVLLLVMLLYLGPGQSWTPAADAAIHAGFEDEAAFNAIPDDQIGTDLFIPFMNTDPAWGWQTTAVIQNPGANLALLTLRYYDQAGTEVNTVVDSLAAKASRTYTPTGVFSGSLVVESTESIAAIVQEFPADPGWTADGGMAYTAVNPERAATGLVIQPLLRNYATWNTFFVVQNVGSAAAEVTITFADDTGAVVTTDVATIPARAARWYDPRTIPALPDNFYGIGYVESVTPLVGVNHIFSNVTGSRAVNAISTGAAPAMNRVSDLAEYPSGPASILEEFISFLPILINTSGIELVNLGAIEALFVIEFYDAGGSVVWTESGMVYPGLSLALYLGTMGLPAGFQGSAVVYSDHLLAIQGATDWQAQSPRTQTMYAAIDISSTTTQALVPYARHLEGEVITMIAVQAAGLAADVMVEYRDLNGTLVYSDTAMIPAAATQLFDQAIAELPSPFQGSALVVSSEPIAVVGYASHKRQVQEGTIAGTVLLQGRSDHSDVEVCALDGAVEVACTLTGSGGAFNVTVPEGSYTVAVEMARYLDGEKAGVVVTAGNITSLPQVTLRGGDSNDDDVVNILDLSFMGARYLLSCGDPGYNVAADINNDCIINIQDIVLGGGNYLATSPVDWP